ncbi:MAG: hypothetical protein ACLP9L_26945, partial [Thermoguttaceae bacterium]
VTKPIVSNSRLPAVVSPHVDSGGLVPVFAARHQMALLCGYRATHVACNLKKSDQIIGGGCGT